MGRERATEHLRNDPRFGGAPGMGEQAPVIRLGGRVPVDRQPLAQPHRDQRRLQAMLEGQAHAEVGRQAQGAHHLSRPHPLSPQRLLRHAETVTGPRSSAWGSSTSRAANRFLHVGRASKLLHSAISTGSLPSDRSVATDFAGSVTHTPGSGRGDASDSQTSVTRRYGVTLGELLGGGGGAEHAQCSGHELSVIVMSPLVMGT
jgi:hypothetical protein